jgi:hypothetical protein
VIEWHTVALYIKGKNAVIYDPSFKIPTSEKIPEFLEHLAERFL